MLTPMVPRHVLEHFRAPRNKRPMSNPTAQGAVPWGHEDRQVLTLFLRIGSEGRVAEASFTNTGDRSADASMAGTSVDDYILRGQLDAIDTVRDRLGVPSVHVIAKAE